jgi:WD40 repeat protein
MQVPLAVFRFTLIDRMQNLDCRPGFAMNEGQENQHPAGIKSARSDFLRRSYSLPEVAVGSSPHLKQQEPRTAMVPKEKSKRFGFESMSATYEPGVNQDETGDGGRLSRHIPHPQDETNVDVHELREANSAVYSTAATSFTYSNCRDEEPSQAQSTQLPVSQSASIYKQLLVNKEEGVLRFGHEQPTNLPRMAQSQSEKKHRIIQANPFRVLDAPDLSGKEEVIDWSQHNNRVVIGLKSIVYQWDGVTQKSSRLVQLNEDSHVNVIKWLPKCSVLSLSIASQGSYVYDCDKEKFLRLMKPPEGKVTCKDFHSVIMAMGTGDKGNIYLYDLRQKSALQHSIEAHHSPITTVKFCHSEPHYLLAGCRDGTVSVWDYRMPTQPRYLFDKLHAGPVRSAAWNPEYRYKFFTGGERDGLLRLVNTHAAVADGSPKPRIASTSPVEVTVNTGSSVNSIICPPNSGEVLTAQSAGHMQLRSTQTLAPIGRFHSPDHIESISCATLSPDMRTICAAQNENLKFWCVFDGRRGNEVERPVTAATTGPTREMRKRDRTAIDDCLR